MKHNKNQVGIAILTILLSLSTGAFAQLPFWSNNGNNAGSTDFLGTNNNQPLILKSNSTEGLRILTNGNVRINSFLNLGNGLVTSSNGVLGFNAFPNDTNMVLAGSGTFKSISSLSGWTRTGNVLYNSTGVNVGIGIQNPNYPLEVQGSAYFHGTLYADGVILTNKMLVDTLKTGVMFTLNNNLNMRGGSLNEIYTSSGDLRFQSNAASSGNTIFNAGMTGYVGIGTYTPQYKLDVVGAVRFSNDVYVSRLRPLPGDTMVIIGDSSVWIGVTQGNNFIRPSNRGLGIGSGTAIARGQKSLALGEHVATLTGANNAIVMGSGAGFVSLTNAIPNSLMIGFNSDKPTIFVAPATGQGTLGKVGVGTSSPDALFQVGAGASRITFDQVSTNQQGFTSYVGFNAHRDPATGIITFDGDGASNNSGSLILQDDEGALRFYIKHSSGGTNQTTTSLHAENGAIMTLREDRVQIGQRGISATSPYYNNTELSVDGRIMCGDLIVTAVDWQDEVFDSTYTLMPLDSVQAYIKQYGHLPGVKSEETIEGDGMSVSETDAEQQQKIEELTLYILQLDARLKALEEENKQLKEQQPK